MCCIDCLCSMEEKDRRTRRGQAYKVIRNDTESGARD